MMAHHPLPAEKQEPGNQTQRPRAQRDVLLRLNKGIQEIQARQDERDNQPAQLNIFSTLDATNNNAAALHDKTLPPRPRPSTQRCCSTTLNIILHLG
ncbi:hypothetical protein E2C01_019323 [Portunus trituberculatus]|uniref:Uncharacterized protein n=1 Tax=Portunus trituberculatus TaxID=210409 RepID=A0A5B7DYK0_PORTR|nr:hypothetical protein [Portunus trituberculatus]